MEKCDVCIICALAEEADAFIKVLKQKPEVQFERKHSQIQQRDYFHATMTNAKSEKLNILVTWQTRMGMMDAGLTFEKLLQEFDTRFVAMTGFCAGNPKRVKMGDIIVAEKTFNYDSGSMITNQSGQKEQRRSTITFQTRNDILHITRFFEEWKSAIATYQTERPISKHQQRDWLLNQLFEKQITIYDLDKKELTNYAPNWKEILEELQQGERPLINKETRGVSDPTAFKRFIFDLDDFPYQDTTKPTECFIGALASGNLVRRDDPFEEIEQIDHRILGLDMEGTAIYYALQDRSHIRSLVVKGVSDYADGNKDDRYHSYAATLSAAYVATFITQFVNDEYMPWPDKPISPSTPSTISQPTTSSSQTPKPSSTTLAAETTKPSVKIVFSCSEAEEDQKLIAKFSTHLSLLKRRKPPLIENWDRHHIEAGNSTSDDIRNKLLEAQIILLMMSPDYYNSDYYDEEIQLIEQCRLNGTKVIPILLRPTDDSWKKAEFYGDLLPLPRNNKPVSSWSDKDVPLSEIAKEIRVVAENIQKS